MAGDRTRAPGEPATPCASRPPRGVDGTLPPDSETRSGRRERYPPCSPSHLPITQGPCLKTPGAQERGAGNGLSAAGFGGASPGFGETHRWCLHWETTGGQLWEVERGGRPVAGVARSSGIRNGPSWLGSGRYVAQDEAADAEYQCTAAVFVLVVARRCESVGTWRPSGERSSGSL